MKKPLLIIAVIFTIPLVSFIHPQNNEAKLYADERNLLAGTYQNMNKQDDFFKVLVLKNDGNYRRSDVNHADLINENATRSVSGGWYLRFDVAELGKQITFKGSIYEHYTEATFCYFLSHDTLHLASEIFGIPDWHRPYLLKRMK